VLALGFLSAGLLSLNTENVWLRFEKLYKQDMFSSVTSRKLATQATLDMVEDGWVTGHGAGGFRFLFPQYQQHYQKIYRPEIREGNKVVSWRLYWEHAHNDYAELLAELGLIGLGLAASVVIGCFIAARKSGLTSHPGLLVMFGGPALVAATAAVDFPFHNPAVIFTCAAVIVLTLRWAQLSRRA
jgi:O-antigen ligase